MTKKLAVTRLQAIALTQELWKWCVNNPHIGKHTWPRWKELGDMYLACPLCEYSSQKAQREGKGSCWCCPYIAVFGSCMDGPYNLSGQGSVPEYTEQFYDQLMQLK